MIRHKHLMAVMLYVVLLVVSKASAQLPATNAHSFTLQEAVDYAKKNNTQVKNALLNLQIQRQENRGIAAAALPSLSGNIGYTQYFNFPTQVIPAGSFKDQTVDDPVNFGLNYAASGGLQLQQLLFDGQVFVGLQARKASLDFQSKNVEVTEEAIKVNVEKVYYQLVVSKTQVKLLDANIARLEKLEHDSKELYKNGFAEKLDVDKVNVQLTNLKTQKISVLNSINIGYVGLKTLMGVPVKDELQLTDTLSEAEIKDGILQDAPYQYNDRKEFQYALLGKKLNEYNIKRYQLSYLPTVALSGTYAKQAYRHEFNFFGKGDWYPASWVSLNISVPLFDGFAKDAKVKQSKLELQQTENNIDNLKLNIDAEVEQATLNFKSAIATIDFQKKNMELAEAVYNKTKKKYEVGTGSNTEINAAETDLVTAQTNYINALYNAIIAKVDYKKAIGKL